MKNCFEKSKQITDTVRVSYELYESADYGGLVTIKWGEDEVKLWADEFRKIATFVAKCQDKVISG